jgi:hypothetical protein
VDDGYEKQQTGKSTDIQGPAYFPKMRTTNAVTTESEGSTMSIKKELNYLTNTYFS